MTFPATLLNWAAWAPGLEQRTDWQAWAHDSSRPLQQDGQPVLAFVPAMARRRMSRLTRMALQVAEDCRGPARPIPTVFASRHGELARSFGILQAIAAGEPVSPMDFSVSVHNSAAGLYSIQQQDRSASTTISAGPDTLPMAFIECHAQLQAGAAEVLLVMADEPVPALYQSFTGETGMPYALALLLGRTDAGQMRISLQGRNSENDNNAMPQGLQLARLLAGGGSHCDIGRWQWTLA